MTTFYVDSVNGNDVNNGESIGAAYKTLNKPTEAARLAGDIVILRRGLGTDYDDGGNLDFLSDGVVENPIIITADNANAFSDDVDLSVTATATLTFGSKTITFASDISSVCAAGDWIYVAAEDADEFAYEVDSVSTVTVTLFLPYKGAQAGSGKTMTNMQSSPIWGTAAGSIQVDLSGDNFWKFQGIHFRGTNVNGAFEVDSAASPVFKDCVFEGNGASDYGVRFTDDWIPAQLFKCRTFNCIGIGTVVGNGGFTGEARDCLFDGNSASNTVGLQCTGAVDALFVDSEFKNYPTGDIDWGTFVTSAGIVRLRNCILASTTELDTIDASLFGRAFIEDHDGVLDDTRQLSYLSSAEATPIIQSETTTVRSGGGNIAIKVTPSTKLSTLSEHASQKLFEYGFYATTNSKTYTVYFRPSATADWTADPVVGELWIELEYWGHASNNFRRITKSTGVIDMNGSTSWQTLTVTIAPAQAGVAYLRCWYAKTKESGKSNVFFCDTNVEVT